MKNGFRQSMAWLHTYSGLLVGWVLFLVFSAGTAAYFRSEISLWMQPELHRAALPVPSAATQPEAAQRAARWLSEHAPGSPRWFIGLPSERDRTLRVMWRLLPGQAGAHPRRRLGEAVLDPATGQALTGVRATRGGEFFYRLHFDLHYMPALWARCFRWIYCSITRHSTQVAAIRGEFTVKILPKYIFNGIYVSVFAL